MFQGQADVFVGHDESRVDIKTMNEGEFFGEMALITTQARTASVVAKTECVCYKLTNKVFTSVLGPVLDVIAPQMVKRYSQNRLYAALRTLPSFSSLEDGELNEICNAMSTEYFNDGQTIIREGASGDELKFWVIIQGDVTITKDDKMLTRLHAGQFMGEMAIISDTTTSATAKACGKVECAGMDRVAFNQLVSPVLSKILNADAGSDFMSRKLAHEHNISSHETVMTQNAEASNKMLRVVNAHEMSKRQSSTRNLKTKVDATEGMEFASMNLDEDADEGRRVESEHLSSATDTSNYVVITAVSGPIRKSAHVSPYHCHYHCIHACIC